MYMTFRSYFRMSRFRWTHVNDCPGSDPQWPSNLRLMCSGADIVFINGTPGLQNNRHATANEAFSGRMRELLQQRFGDAGRGFLPPGIPYRYYRPAQVTVQSSGFTVISAFSPSTRGPFGLAALRQHADGPADMADGRGRHFGRASRRLRSRLGLGLLHDGLDIDLWQRGLCRGHRPDRRLRPDRRRNPGARAASQGPGDRAGSRCQSSRPPRRPSDRPPAVR